MINKAFDPLGMHIPIQESRTERHIQVSTATLTTSHNLREEGSGSGSGSGLYSGGLTWSIVLRCDDHTGIFTWDGCARDPHFYVPAETQSYVIKLFAQGKP